MQNLKSPAIHTNYTTNHEFSKYTYGVATKYDYKFKMLINDTMYFCILYLSNFYVPSVFIVCEEKQPKANILLPSEQYFHSVISTRTKVKQ